MKNVNFIAYLITFIVVAYPLGYCYSAINHPLDTTLKYPKSSIEFFGPTLVIGEDITSRNKQWITPNGIYSTAPRVKPAGRLILFSFLFGIPSMGVDNKMESEINDFLISVNDFKVGYGALLRFSVNSDEFDIPDVNSAHLEFIGYGLSPEESLAQEGIQPALKRYRSTIGSRYGKVKKRYIWILRKHSGYEISTTEDPFFINALEGKAFQIRTRQLSLSKLFNVGDFDFSEIAVIDKWIEKSKQIDRTNANNRVLRQIDMLNSKLTEKQIELERLANAYYESKKNVSNLGIALALLESCISINSLFGNENTSQLDSKKMLYEYKSKESASEMIMLKARYNKWGIEINKITDRLRIIYDEKGIDTKDLKNPRMIID